MTVDNPFILGANYRAPKRWTEWHTDTWFIDGKPCAFGGAIEAWRDPKTGEIITREIKGARSGING